MSAIAVAVGTDGIIVASDGVCYTYETGEVSGFVSKIILLPEYDCFIGSTGAGAFMTALRWELDQQITCFDDLVTDFEDLCARVHRKLFSNAWGFYEPGPLTEVCCVIGGWSEDRQRYEGYRLVSYAKHGVNHGDGSTSVAEPFTAMLLPDGLWCTQSPDPETMVEFGLPPSSPHDETIDVLSRMICACRAESGLGKNLGGEDRFNMIGGFLQLTVLQRNIVQSYIPYRWEEDRIGERIDPTGSNRFPQWLRDRHEAALAEAPKSRPKK